MPLNIRGKVYPAPLEGDQPGIKGSEMIAIEDHFGLDALLLIGELDNPNPSVHKGYTKAKAMYAFAWICLTRAGEILSLQDVLDDYAVDELVEMEIDDIKKEAINLLEAEQENI